LANITLPPSVLEVIKKRGRALQQETPAESPGPFKRINLSWVKCVAESDFAVVDRVTQAYGNLSEHIALSLEPVAQRFAIGIGDLQTQFGVVVIDDFQKDFLFLQGQVAMQHVYSFSVRVDEKRRLIIADKSWV
jgi:hypothetical protein